MAAQNDSPALSAELSPTFFELPIWLVEPAVRSCRMFNTALDYIFYDVPTLRAALTERDAPMQAEGEKPEHIDRILSKPPKASELQAALAELEAPAARGLG